MTLTTGFFLIVFGWIFYIISGIILGAIFGSHKYKIGGFVAGFINPFFTIFGVTKIFIEKNINNCYDIFPILLILLPLTLINLRAIYNSGIQDATGDNSYGVSRTFIKTHFLSHNVSLLSLVYSQGTLWRRKINK